MPNVHKAGFTILLLLLVSACNNRNCDCPLDSLYNKEEVRSNTEENSVDNDFLLKLSAEIKKIIDVEGAFKSGNETKKVFELLREKNVSIDSIVHNRFEITKTLFCTKHKLLCSNPDISEERLLDSSMLYLKKIEAEFDILAIKPTSTTPVLEEEPKATPSSATSAPPSKIVTQQKFFSNISMPHLDDFLQKELNMVKSKSASTTDHTIIFQPTMKKIQLKNGLFHFPGGLVKLTVNNTILDIGKIELEESSPFGNKEGLVEEHIQQQILAAVSKNKGLIKNKLNEFFN